MFRNRLTCSFGSLASLYCSMLGILNLSENGVQTMLSMNKLSDSSSNSVQCPYLLAIVIPSFTRFDSSYIVTFHSLVSSPCRPRCLFTVNPQRDPPTSLVSLLTLVLGLMVQIFLPRAFLLSSDHYLWMSWSGVASGMFFVSLLNPNFSCGNDHIFHFHWASPCPIALFQHCIFLVDVSGRSWKILPIDGLIGTFGVGTWISECNLSDGTVSVVIVSTVIHP